MASSAVNRRLRVLTLVDGIGTFGGGERLARQIAIHLDRSRFEPTFCVTRWKHEPMHDPALEELRSTGVAFLGLERSGRFQLRPWRDLVTYMREHRVEVIHAHKTGSSVWGALLGPWARSPVLIAHEHGRSAEELSHRRLLDRYLIAPRADAFVAVSEAERQRMVEVDRIAADKVRVIPNGIGPGRQPDPERDVRVELDIGQDQPVVGIVATLRPEKAIDVLLEATVTVRKAAPGVKVLVAGGETPGTPGERSRIESVARELGVADSLLLLGARRDVPEVLAAVDVAVLCSDQEASPLSVMEYMEAGKPVVATRVGGVPEIVEEGVTGLLVERQDPDRLAEAVISLLRDPERAAKMGAAGAARQRGAFSIEATARRVGELYEELLAAKELG